MNRFLSAFAIGLVLGGTAHALPFLQLDVSDGIYDEVTETTTATSNVFTLFALLNSTNAAGTYNISAALAPAPSQSGANLGSFVFNGATINATTDMTWGSPALMPAHDVYPTWYKQFDFTFNPLLKTNNYNVEDDGDTHANPTTVAGGNALYKPFVVDVSALSNDAVLVFDLYTYQGSSNKIKIKFAPFSHNAQASYIQPETVPDGSSTFVLLGLGFAVLVSLNRRKAA
jgi:hypothetical protein